MLDALYELALFSTKAFVVVLLILILLAGVMLILGRGKGREKGKIIIKNLNQKYHETDETLLETMLSRSQFKKFLKDKKTAEKAELKKSKKSPSKKSIFVLNFHGDMKANAVNSLCEEVNAILGIAKPTDEVVVRVESAGGVVHGYGLAASQLLRFRQRHIPLTVTVDKVAASGGYLMACVANKILAAPFAIIGSIGVIVQLPNFHRLLKENNIDFEQITAGAYKRTLTLFGKNTDEGREKMREEVQEIHDLFKDLIHEYRQHLDIQKVATGEFWLGKHALALNLVDELNTSDEYLLNKSKTANLYEICYQTKKSLGERLSSSVQMFKAKLTENIF